MYKQYKRYLQIIVIVIIVVLASIFLIFYRPVALWGNTYYEPVYTGSMEPAIPVGGIVVIQTVGPTTLKVGDVICFRHSEASTITHRIVSQAQDGFITKGDANEEPDLQPVNYAQIVGKVTFTIPLVGYLGFFVKTPIGFVALILFPASALIFLEIKKVLKRGRKQNL